MPRCEKIEVSLHVKVEGCITIQVDPGDEDGITKEMLLDAVEREMDSSGGMLTPSGAMFYANFASVEAGNLSYEEL